MSQVLEIPPFTTSTFPSGGANLPADVPPLANRQTGNQKVFDSLVNMYRNKRGGLFSKDSGCCPCQGNRPYDQTPYREPRQSGGLGQPERPIKPFQQPKDPCDVTREKLAGMGLTPEELNDCLRGGARRSSSSRRTTKRKKRSGPKKLSTVTRYYQRLGKKGSGTVSRKKKARTSGNVSASRTVGKYRLLSNGACYDPRTRKFVKRANCR